jgi:hypothetical protein
MRNGRSMVLMLAGLMVGLVGGALFVSRAQAQAPAAPPARFQYKCLTGLPAQMYKPETLNALNREGGDGWRLLDALSGQNHLSGGDQYCFIKQY